LSEEVRRKTAEFAMKYPQYVSEGHIQFPIHDEYLNVYQGIFSNNGAVKKPEVKTSSRKPFASEDPVIP
jgi:hypothetical protein